MDDPVVQMFRYFWFFLPAFVANQCPGFALWILKRLDREDLNAPIWEWGCGPNKTWMGYLAAMTGATLTLYAQYALGTRDFFGFPTEHLWALGAVIGIGVISGDAVKSFVKRRLKHPPGAPFWPFDQLDFVVGAHVVLACIFGWWVWKGALMVGLFTIALHPHINMLGYQLGLRKVPH